MGVLEDALMEELYYLIGHIAHSEQHLLEIDSEIGIPVFLDEVNNLRMTRKDVGKVLFEVMFGGLKSDNPGEFRSKAESLWCTIKHLTMALIHCDECIEKLERRFSEKKDPSIIENIKTLLDTRKKIRELLMRMQYLSEIGQFENVEAIRCREDLCLEEEEEK